MIELALAGAPYRCLFFGREELPAAETALAPLLEREPLRAELVVVMEPTANELHAGCLGNINATWTFHGRSGHSARPWMADNAIERAAAGVSALAARPARAARLRRARVRRGGVRDADRGRHRHERDPRPGECARELPLRARPHAGGGRGAARASSCDGHGELRIDANAPSGPGRARRRWWTRWSPPATSCARPSRPGRRWRSSAPRASTRSTSAPATRRRRTRATSHVAIAALVRAYRVLEAFARCG